MILRITQRACTWGQGGLRGSAHAEPWRWSGAVYSLVPSCPSLRLAGDGAMHPCLSPATVGEHAEQLVSSLAILPPARSPRSLLWTRSTPAVLLWTSTRRRLSPASA